MKPINKFIKKTLIIGSPIICYFVLSISIYLYVDPFSVIYDYDNPYENKPIISKNRDYVSSYMFDKNNPKYHYNSFILGNSRSIFYPVSHWQQYLSNDASPFHYDASGDDILGISSKLIYIDKQGNHIDNVLIMLDYESFYDIMKKDAPLFNRPAQIDTTTTRITNHLDFIISFVTSPKMNIAIIDYSLFNKKRDYMCDIFTVRNLNYKTKTNEISYDSTELLISREPDKFYTPELMKVFYLRDSIEIYESNKILEPQKRYLKNIVNIFTKHNTAYKIIINPLYDQRKLATEDLEYLKEIFGPQNVYDFSGKNSITDDYRNYYENSHYRPHVAKIIIDSIYNS